MCDGGGVTAEVVTVVSDSESGESGVVKAVAIVEVMRVTVAW